MDEVLPPHLISIYGTHPELRSAIRAQMFMSERGRSGSSIYADRGQENANLMQKQRNLTSNVFDSLLFTKLLQPMMHVARVFKAMFGVDPIDQGLRSSIHNEVETVVKYFIATVGTNDLTQHTDLNNYWHTGNPVTLRSAANMQEYMPWVWIWRVANGLSRGRDMCRPEHFWVYTLRHIRDHCFYQ